MAFFDVVDSLFFRSDVTVRKFATKNSEKPSRGGEHENALQAKVMNIGYQKIFIFGGVVLS